jgi:hypothetical protein
MIPQALKDSTRDYVWRRPLLRSIDLCQIRLTSALGADFALAIVKRHWQTSY